MLVTKPKIIIEIFFPGDHNSVKKLIDSGTDVNTLTDDGLTALHKAVEKGQEKTAKLLIESGADVNAQDQNGLTPLHVSAAKGTNEQISELKYF